MIRKLLALISFSFLFAVPAYAVQTWTVKTSGTIDFGFATGIYSSNFGGGDEMWLSGLTFSQTVTTSVDPVSWAGGISTSNYNKVSAAATGPAFSTTITINGVSTTFEASTSAGGQQYLGKWFTNGVAGLPDYIISEQVGSTARNGRIQADIYISGLVSLLPQLSFNQDLYQDLRQVSITENAYFDYSGVGGQVHFEASTLKSIILNNGVAPVPEPETYAMLLAGFLLVGIAARRQSVFNVA